MTTPKNKNISYAAANKSEEIDWENILIELINDGTMFDDDDAEWTRLFELANAWDTCATGQLSNLVKRNDGEPQDNILSTWGRKFTSEFQNQNWHGALEMVQRMQLRAPLVIATEKYNTEVREFELEQKVASLKDELASVNDRLKIVRKTLKEYN